MRTMNRGAVAIEGCSYSLPPARIASRSRSTTVRVNARMGRDYKLDFSPSFAPGGALAGAGPSQQQDGIVANDPENLYKGLALKTGIIEKRMAQKQMEKDKDFAKAMNEASDELRKAALVRRETRRPPANNEELVEYFLNTVTEDMEYEVARYRPRLTQDFFRHLDNLIGSIRFSIADKADEGEQDRLAELELLRRYLAEAAEAVDRCVDATKSAKDRLKALLQAKDKKAHILEMAANNEIDQALMDLLTQNIEAARAAEQEDAAKFMEKVKQACAKYFVATPAAVNTAIPQAPQELGAKSGNSPTMLAGVPLVSASPAAPASAAAPAPQAQPAAPTKLILDPKAAAPKAPAQQQAQQQEKKLIL